MRLISALVKNYRIHKELRIDFDPKMTVIVGPNETGKSTLIEAVHRALFLKARTGGRELERMKSMLHSGHPEVTVCFEAKGSRCEVTKLFRGNSGTAVVKIDGKTFHNDHAEHVLGELLGEAPVDGKSPTRLGARWNHLWVWQGQGGIHPAKAIEERNNSLIRRLQKEQGAIVQQSDKDAAVADYFRREYSRFFTAKGQISRKKDNELFEKQQRLEKLQALVEEARLRVDRLETARSDYLQASQVEKQTGKELERIRLELDQVAKKLADVEELSKRLEKHKARFQELEKEKVSLEKLDQEMVELKRRITKIEEELGPKEKELKDLDSEIATKQKRLDLLRSSNHEKVRRQLQSAEAELQLLTLCKESLRVESDICELEKKVERIEQLEKKQKEIERSLAKLPKITKSQRTRISQLSSDIKSAKARLEGLSARIEVSESDLQVKVDGRPVPVGTHVTVSSTCEVTVGDSTKITVTPGGGTTLADAVSELKRLEEELASLLSQIGVQSVEDALLAYEAIREEQSRLEAVRSGLKELKGEKLKKDLNRAKLTKDAVEEEIVRLASKVPGWIRPADLVETVERIRQVKTKIQGLKNEENALLNEIRNLDEQLQTDRKRREITQKKINELKEILTEARAKLNVKQEEAGDDRQRAEQLLQVEQQMENEMRLIQALNRQIEELSPETLRIRLEKLEKAEERLNEEIRQARETMLRAETMLELDGSVDPRAELDERMAAADQAKKEYEAVLRRANAISRVHQLFTQEQQRLADRYSRPLSEKISSYATMIFGGLSKVDSRFSENSLHSITLLHQKFGGTEFDFESLSGGAREQLAAAVRLAVAEILAEEHDGCLPLVFDDSFTNGTGFSPFKTCYSRHPEMVFR